MTKPLKKYSAQEIANAVFERGKWMFEHGGKFSLWRNMQENLQKMKFSGEKIREFHIILQICATTIFAEKHNGYSYEGGEEALLACNFNFAVDQDWPNGFKAMDEDELSRRTHQDFFNTLDFRQKLYDSFVFALIQRGYKDAENMKTAAPAGTNRPRRLFLIPNNKELATPTANM